METKDDSNRSAQLTRAEHSGQPKNTAWTALLCELLIERGYRETTIPTGLTNSNSRALRLSSGCIDHGVGRLIEISDDLVVKVDCARSVTGWFRSGEHCPQSVAKRELCQ